MWEWQSRSPLWRGELWEPKCRGKPVGGQVGQAHAGNSSLGFILKSGSLQTFKYYSWKQRKHSQWKGAWGLGNSHLVSSCPHAALSLLKPLCLLKHSLRPLLNPEVWSDSSVYMHHKNRTQTKQSTPIDGRNPWILLSWGMTWSNINWCLCSVVTVLGGGWRCRIHY